MKSQLLTIGSTNDSRLSERFGGNSVDAIFFTLKERCPAEDGIKAFNKMKSELKSEF